MKTMHVRFLKVTRIVIPGALNVVKIMQIAMHLSIVFGKLFIVKLFSGILSKRLFLKYIKLYV